MTKYVNNNGVSEMWLNIKNWVTSQLLGYSQTGHTHSASDITSGLATVATSGSYNDLSNKPTIPTVNDATLTIQQNGTTVDTFTANASSNVTANITVPTKTSDLTNDSCIPLAGTNALAGNIIPSTDNAYSLGSSIYNLKSVNTKRVQQNNISDFLFLVGASNWNEGASIALFGKSNTTFGGEFRIDAHDGTVFTRLEGTPSGTLTWGSKNVAMQEDVVPRSGGAVLGTTYTRTDNNSQLVLSGGLGWANGATLVLHGTVMDGAVIFVPSDGTNNKQMWLNPNGTWTWQGQAVQLVSDQRLKQQISEIDDKLLDAWEDVELSQFKYNDAVDQKKDKARLHTGYVVQQIDSACKSHNVDISEYGLYCHEVYQEETEEVEVEQKDGTKVKERKVIREASEHYSLRYTEALIVECAYLRKKLKELTARIEQLEKGNKEEVK